MHLKTNKVNDAKHLANLYAHMNRSARKYDAIRDQVFVQVIKELTQPYNDKMVHYVVEYETTSQAQLVANYLMQHLNDPTYALTIVAGAQPDGSIIVPCIHIVFDNAYTKALGTLLGNIGF